MKELTTEEKTIFWKPVSEYTGGRVLATNGVDILIGELNPEGDCVSEECCTTLLCGITHFAKIDGLFPTLRESEDERIRKALIDYFDDANKADENPLQSYGIHTDKAIAWLEKQDEQKPTLPKWKYKNDNTPLLRDSIILNKYGCVAKSPSGALVSDVWVIDYDELAKLPKEEIEKQGKQKLVEKYNITGIGSKNAQGKLGEMIKNLKSADKVEPKFHEGEWITNGDYTWKIVEVKPLDYILQSQDGNIVDDTISHVDEQFHSFTIQDAKDGDVLYLQHDGKEHIIIYKGVIKERFRTFVSAYCAYNGIVDAFCFADVDRYIDIIYGGIMPATKEQCDLLFKSMKDDGYEWDAESKELKKIDTFCQENCKGFQETGKCLADGECKAKKEYMKQKPTDWSEEDERERKRVVGLLEGWLSTFKETNYAEDCKRGIEWLKSLNGKIQSKQEWSEEDEAKRNALIGIVKEIKNQPLKRLQDWDGYISWLESLRPQPKQVWSEEDKNYYDAIITKLEVTKDDALLTNNQMEFLKSLKDRVQPQQVWSEEDEKILNSALWHIKNSCSNGGKNSGEFEVYNWLKSLKPQNHWKPTGAQLASLTIACDRNDRVGFDLTELLKELKKL